MWRGHGQIASAIDQLLGYLTWRDRRAALILFNKSNSNFGAVLKALAGSLTGHPKMLREIPWPDCGEWRFVFSSHGDESSSSTVHVFAFDLYEPS
jgi:hypothetical protein